MSDTDRHTVPGTLRDVLPTAAAAVGVPTRQLWVPRQEDWGVPDTTRICVLLVDGLGYELLRDRAGHAPFLASASDNTMRLRSEFPSTTATSLGSLGTGLPPGAHGMFGYLVRDPATDSLLNGLAWDLDVDPREWQPHLTVFEHAVAHGVETFQVGPANFIGSGVTEAALRGATYCSAQSLAARMETTERLLRAHEPCLIYTYWGDVDKVGHQSGCGSLAWGDELTMIDSAIRSLVASLPKGAVLIVTADHGMVDVPPAHWVDVAHHPELARGVRYVGGEPRAPMLYCHPESGEAVATRWRDFLGDKASVYTRAEAFSGGLYGALTTVVADQDRVGDVVVSMRGTHCVVDSRKPKSSGGRLIGMHGAMTSAETDIPLIRFVG